MKIYWPGLGEGADSIFKHMFLSTNKAGVPTYCEVDGIVFVTRKKVKEVFTTPAFREESGAFNTQKVIGFRRFIELLHRREELVGSNNLQRNNPNDEFTQIHSEMKAILKDLGEEPHHGSYLVMFLTKTRTRRVNI